MHLGRDQRPSGATARVETKFNKADAENNMLVWSDVGTCEKDDETMEVKILCRKHYHKFSLRNTPDATQHTCIAGVVLQFQAPNFTSRKKSRVRSSEMLFFLSDSSPPSCDA